MSDQLVYKLGKVITGEAERDAVHVAVAPVTAGEKLHPSQRISLDSEGNAVAASYEPIGIVDPFLTHAVDKGDRFFLWVQPGTIRSLRHDWVHPAMPKPTNQSEAEKWLDDKAREFGWKLDTLKKLATDYWAKGDQYCGDYEGYDFGKHYPEIREKLAYIGIQVPAFDEDNYFRCSC